MNKLVRDLIMHGTGSLDSVAPAWRETPMVPVKSFRRRHGDDLGLGAAVPEAMFRSSGTTGDRPSVHRFPSLDWFRDVISVSFPQEWRGMDTLCLTGHRAYEPNSACAFWGTTVAELFGKETCFPCGERVDMSKAAEFISMSSGRPILVIGTTHYIAELLDYAKLELPVGSVVLTTGGIKGLEHRQQDLYQFHSQLGYEWPQATVHQSYGMTELTTAFYGDTSNTYNEHPWTRVHTVDPVSLRRQQPGKVGRICIFDLANDIPHILTDDIGVSLDGTFEILGRKPL